MPINWFLGAAVKPPPLAEFPSPSSTIALLLLLQLSATFESVEVLIDRRCDPRGTLGANRVLSNEVGVHLAQASKSISRGNPNLDQFASLRSALRPTEIRLDEEYDSGAN